MVFARFAGEFHRSPLARLYEGQTLKKGCDIGGAKELGVIYFPTNWGAKEPQNPPNHRVDENDCINS